MNAPEYKRLVELERRVEALEKRLADNGPACPHARLEVDPRNPVTGRRCIDCNEQLWIPADTTTATEPPNCAPESDSSRSGPSRKATAYGGTGSYSEPETSPIGSSDSEDAPRKVIDPSSNRPAWAIQRNGRTWLYPSHESAENAMASDSADDPLFESQLCEHRNYRGLCPECGDHP